MNQSFDIYLPPDFFNSIGGFRTFAGRRGNGEVAPKEVIRSLSWVNNRLWHSRHPATGVGLEE